MAVTTNTTGPTWIVENYQYDSRMQDSSQASTILRNIQRDINEMRREMEKLRGFYGWMIHAYPETIAQYKALMDLQRASNELTSPAAEQAYGQSRAKSAI